MDIKNKINSYTLYLTNCCQLNCPYCYEKRNRELNGKYIMPWEDIKAIIDFAKSNYNGEQLEFSLFGGEPLFFLKDQVFKIIDYLKKNFLVEQFRITIMSNGLNLSKELIEYLNGLNWFILISFDGPYELIHDNIPKPAFDRIVNNITSLSEEIRATHIGLKATIPDDFIDQIDVIYNYLNNFHTAVVYLSPTHEIDHFRITPAIKKIQNNIGNTRDGQIISQKIKLKSGIELYFRRGEITLLGHSYHVPFNKPVGWFQNGKVSISWTLLLEKIKTFPGIADGQLYLYPEDKNKCSTCKLKDKICIPLDGETDHLNTTQCLWYSTIQEVI